jgi:hypothetical protein
MLIGLLSGFFGIGGGIVGIPVLLQCFARQGMPQSISMHMAIGTMLAIAAVTTLTAMHKHHKNNMILVPLCKKLAPCLVGGSLIGSMISSHIDAMYLQKAFALFLLFAAFRLAKSSKQEAAHPPSNLAIVPTTTLCIGVLSGLLGLGGGVLLVPYLHLRGIPLKNAIATATACIVPAAMLGAVSYMMMNVSVGNAIASNTGYIYWPAFFGISLTSMLFAPLGAHLTKKTSAPALKAAFSILLIAIAFHLSQ